MVSIVSVQQKGYFYTSAFPKRRPSPTSPINTPSCLAYVILAYCTGLVGMYGMMLPPSSLFKFHASWVYQNQHTKSEHRKDEL